MHGTRWAVAAVCALAAVGCLPRYDELKTQFGRLRKAGEAGGVVLHTALLDQPAGEPFLARDIWAAVDQSLPADRKAILDENGLRAGRLVGATAPPAFHQLLWSEFTCINPRELTLRDRATTIVPVVGPLDRTSFRALKALSGEPVRYDLTQAAGGLAVTAQVDAAGKVKLTCEPQVQHGERKDWLRPTADGVGLAWHGEKPLERFPTLAFDLTLAPDEFLVVGTPAGRDDTLGAMLFRPDAGHRVRQRVLVVRTSRVGDAGPGSQKSTALAAQATRPVARGAAER
jgi:hypothetical protein